MAKITTLSMDDAQPVDHTQNYSGATETFAYFDGDEDRLHLHLHCLDKGVQLRVAPPMTDCALFVWQGEVEAGGRMLAAGSSITVERGAVLEIQSVRDDTKLLAFTTKADISDATLEPTGHVRILPEAAVPRYGGVLGGDTIGGAIHADSTCPTCPIWLHENIVPAREKVAHDDLMVHSHTVDEIIFVTGGELRFGVRPMKPGSALAIAANAYYSFTPGPHGVSFINFRPTQPSEIRFKNGQVIDEVGFWRQVGTPQPITIDS